MDPGIVGAVVGGIIGWGASLSSLTLSNYRQRKRDEHQREDEKRLLAGALAAELRGTCRDWRMVMERYNESSTAGGLFASEERYFPVFDGAGHRLFLLPEDLVVDTVTCYLRAKGVVDALRLEGRLFSQIVLAPRDERASIESALRKRSMGLLEQMQSACQQMDDLADRLSNTAHEN